MNSLKNLLVMVFFYLMSLLQPPLQASELAISYYQNKEYDRAQTAFVEYVNNAKNQQVKAESYQQTLIYLSKVLLAKVETEEAVEYIEKALDISANSVEELLLAGDIYCAHAQQVSIFSALGFGKKCIKQYESAAKLFPNNIDAQTKAIQIHIYAPSLVGGDVEKAKSFLKQLQKVSEEASRMLQVEYLQEVEDEAAAITLAEQYAKQTYTSHKNKYQLARFLKARFKIGSEFDLYEPPKIIGYPEEGGDYCQENQLYKKSCY